MKIEDYYETRNTIIGFCEKNNLNHEVQEGEHEVDFISNFGMEAIDLDTLENPTCINAECMLVVYLPQVNDGNTYAKSHYEGVAYGLMEYCKPDYLLGVHDGLVTAVAYCVWSDGLEIDGDKLRHNLHEFLLSHYGYILIPKEKRNITFPLYGENARVVTIKSVVTITDATSCVNSEIYLMDEDDVIWNIWEHLETNQILRLFYLLKDVVNV